MPAIFLQGLKKTQNRLPKPVVTIGNFDGVHLGHQALFTKVRERARAIGGTSVAITFEPHPIRVLQPEIGQKLITPVKRKIALIQTYKIDVVVCIRFDENLARLSPDDFVDKILVNHLGVAEIVVGYDFVFGYKGQGNLNFLRQKGQQAGFIVHSLEPILIDNQPISSTRIRQLLREANIAGARRLMGHPYRMTGRVVSGYGRGKQILGYPTANLQPKNKLLPGTGVYAVLVYLDSQPRPGVTNIGTNLTFGNSNISIETFLIDHYSSLYGRNISLDFIEYLRREKCFSSVEELIIQIRHDIENARGLLAHWLDSGFIN